jgi:hypothetical protein
MPYMPKKKAMPVRQVSFADAAKKLVYGDRNKAYGSPRKDYTRTSAVWSGLLVHKLKPGEVITCEDALVMMVALKLCREMNMHKDDNVIDAHGYLECLEWVISEHQKNERTSEKFLTNGKKSVKDKK